MKVAIIILTVNQRDMTLQCLSSLLCPFTEDDRVGQTQAKLRFMHDRGVINDGGGAQINFLLWQINPVGYGQIARGQFDTAKKCICCGGAMMVRTDVFLQLGGFDTAYDPFGPEDVDFSLRLQKAGYSALYVPQAVAYHVVSLRLARGKVRTMPGISHATGSCLCAATHR